MNRELKSFAEETETITARHLRHIRPFFKMIARIRPWKKEDSSYESPLVGRTAGEPEIWFRIGKLGWGIVKGFMDDRNDPRLVRADLHVKISDVRPSELKELLAQLKKIERKIRD